MSYLNSASKIGPKSIKIYVSSCKGKKFVDPRKQRFCQKVDFKIDLAQKPDLIEKNQGNFRTQRITISLIPLENPGQLKKMGTQCNGFQDFLPQFKKLILSMVSAKWLRTTINPIHHMQST